MNPPETIKLINNPNNPSLHLINKFMQIHQQNIKYAVGDPMVGKTVGGSKKIVKTYNLTGRKTRKKVYAENIDRAIIVGYLLLVKPGRDQFDYKIGIKSYRGFRRRSSSNNKYKYSNYIHPI